jgi:glycosyltransferase involved in cell wall biosynthesis
MRSPPDISLIIKTFERQPALERLLGSIAAQGYADCPIFVADDSKEPYRDEVMAQYADLVDEYVVLPFDSGVSKGRNELLKRVETKYFVTNDDDFVYGERADLAWMHEQLESTDLELIGGLFYDLRDYLPGPSPSLFQRAWCRFLREIGKRREVVRPYHGRFETSGDTLIMKPITYSPPYTRCDYTHQFFMADTQAVRQKVGGWDPGIKAAVEHWEFFYRAKAAHLRVATTEEVGVKHDPVGGGAQYKRFRNEREDKFQRMALERHGFTKRRWLATAMESPEWREFNVK